MDGKYLLYFIIAILIYMLYVVRTQFSTEIDDVFAGIKGTWGNAVLGSYHIVPWNLFYDDYQCV